MRRSVSRGAAVDSGGWRGVVVVQRTASGMREWHREASDMVSVGKDEQNNLRPTSSGNVPNS